MVLTFDFYGNLLSSVDPSGVRMDFVYDSNSLKLKRVLDDTGHIIDYHYNPTTWELDKITDETGEVLVDYEFDPWGKLSSVTDRMGHVTRYEYHPEGMLTKVVLPSEQEVDGEHQGSTRRARSASTTRGSIGARRIAGRPMG